MRRQMRIEFIIREHPGAARSTIQADSHLLNSLGLCDVRNSPVRIFRRCFMVFVIALAIAWVFALTCGSVLKKHAGAFYIGSAVLAAGSAVCAYAGITAGFPVWFSTWVWPIVARGALGTALFVVVMMTGAFANGSAAIKKLMPIRGELSIIASILTLGHNVTYGKTYFVMLFTRPEMLYGTQLAACLTSVIMICIMIPLFITSFKAVRRKMSPKKWKKLQRAAYVFYVLIYVHIMLLSVPMYMRGITSYMANIVVYTAVFGVYGVMRVHKAVVMKHARAKARSGAARVMGSGAGKAV